MGPISNREGSICIHCFLSKSAVGKDWYRRYASLGRVKANSRCAKAGGGGGRVVEPLEELSKRKETLVEGAHDFWVGEGRLGCYLAMRCQDFVSCYGLLADWYAQWSWL